MPLYVNQLTPNRGVIVRRTANTYFVRSGDADLECTLAGRVMQDPGNGPLVVGDVVAWNEAAQIGVFGRMVLAGHIYRGLKPVHWSPSSRTASSSRSSRTCST